MAKGSRHVRPNSSALTRAASTSLSPVAAILILVSGYSVDLAAQPVKGANG